MYGNNVGPCAMFITWMTCQDRLATKEWLKRFNIIQSDTCCFCDKQKNLQHAMFDCEEIKDTDKYVLNWLQIHHNPGAGAKKCNGL